MKIPINRNIDDSLIMIVQFSLVWQKLQQHMFNVVIILVEICGGRDNKFFYLGHSCLVTFPNKWMDLYVNI